MGTHSRGGRVEDLAAPCRPQGSGDREQLREARYSAALVALLCAALMCSCTREVAERDLFHPKDVVFLSAPAQATVLELPREEGVTLAGWGIERSRQLPTMIYFGGNGETVAGSWGRLAWMSRTLAVNLVAFDYRGYGASSGVPDLRHCAADAVAITAAVRTMPPFAGGPLLVYGRSIGGGFAVAAAAGAAVDGLVLEAPPASCAAVVAGWNRNLPWYAYPFITLVAAPSLAEPTLQPVHLITQVHCPLLIMHGDADQVIDPTQGRDLFALAASLDKRFVLLPGTGHNDIRIDAEPVRGSLVDFIGRAQQRAPHDDSTR